MKIKQNNRFKIKNIELIRQLKEGDKLIDKYIFCFMGIDVDCGELFIKLKEGIKLCLIF